MEEGTPLHPRFKSKVTNEVWTRLKEELMKRTLEQVLLHIVGGRGVKRKADDDFHSILGEGKPYALRKRIRVAELENTRDTEMSSYQEKTSSGGRGVKRKADDDFHSVLGEGKPYALRKRIKVAELENTRVDADTEASSSGGRGVKRKADDDFHSVLGEGKPYALRKRIRAAETSSDENSSSGGRGVKRKADDDFHSVLGEGKPYALQKRIRAAETSSDENSSSGQSPVTESHFSTVSSLKIHNTEASCNS
ncbi:uncharacterized protein isoform X1 [Danio rerio]|uniref:Uncharacterized protein isoform X1 n=5 Tax=Danio rerio TaxID=7955 RepID=A0AC58HKI0_DANRE